MNGIPDDLLEVASSVSDGAPVNWEALAGAKHVEDRDLLEELRAIARIAEAHRSIASQSQQSTVSSDQQQWGHLVLKDKLGMGAFGTVYRAWDPRLERDVALKLYNSEHDLLTSDVASLLAEGRLLARVHHANVVVVHGVEQHGDAVGLWGELIDGSTLADEVRARGPLGFREAALIGQDLCGALAAVHQAGLVHRDVKPQNVMRERGGRIVLMDFGIGADLGAESRPNIAGTPLFMAPEAFHGGNITVASDIYSLGVLLFYLVTGTHPLVGSSRAELERSHRERRRRLLHDVRPDLPDAFVRVVERACAPEPADRFATAGAMEQALGGVLGSLSNPAVSPSVTPRRRILWALAASLVLLAGIAAAIDAWTRTSTPDPFVGQMRFEVPPPQGTAFFAGGFALSPDGRSLAFPAVDSTGRSLLWIHSFETGESRPLSRTLNFTSMPFWSPDSRFVAFPSDGKLRTVDVAGGPPQTVCDLISGWGSGSWNRDDVMIFGTNTVLMRVSAAGGAATPLTTLDVSRQETSHRGPKFLPDGRHFVYLRVSRTVENSGLFIGSLDAKPEEQDRRMLVATVFNPVFALSRDGRSGYLLYLREGTILARALDMGTLQLTGDAIVVAQQIGNSGPSFGQFYASANGALAYRHGAASDGTLMWVDRNGRELAPLVPGVLNRPEFPRLSPDGRRLALTIAGDIWVYQVEGRPPIKLTFDDRYLSPLWTPDGRSLVFEGGVNTSSLFSIAADGSGKTPERFGTDGHYHPHAWSADGRWLFAARLDQGRIDIVRIPVGEKGEPQPVVATPAPDGAQGAAISPDGRWLAYASDVTGKHEIWVQAYPGPSAPVRVSPNGGVEPIWARSGRELYYLEADKMMAIPVDTRAGFSFRPAVALFEHRYLMSPQPPSYDVAPDGRFVMIKPADPSAASTPITIVVNWLEGLNPRTPVH